MFLPHNTQTVVTNSRRSWMVALAAILLLIGFSIDSMAAQKSSIIAPLAQKSLLLDVASASGLLTAVGERGHVLLSNDDGKNWEQIKVPTRTMLTGVYFHDGKLGWAVGHEEIILRTDDAGQNWQMVNSYSDDQDSPLFDIWFKDAKTGFAVGAYGRFLVTEDGGLTWTSRLFEPIEIVSNNDSENHDESVDDEYEEDEYNEDYGTDVHLNRLSRSKNGKLYLAAEAGSLFRSVDDGRNWLSLKTPYRGSFYGTLPLTDDTLLIFGLRGHMFRSEDAGKSWQEIETGGQATLTSGCRLSNGAVVVAGLGGAVLVSTDNGKSFMRKNIIGRQSVTAIVENTDKSLLMTGTFGVKKVTLTELGL